MSVLPFAAAEMVFRNEIAFCERWICLKRLNARVSERGYAGMDAHAPSQFYIIAAKLALH